MLRIIKWSVGSALALGLIGGLVFGTDLVSYANTSARSVKTAMKDSVPIEFELQRARDLLDGIIPEMQANVRLIAQEEVEVQELGRDIMLAENSLGEERTRVAKLRNVLNTQSATYVLTGVRYSREQVGDELARSFDRLKEAEVVLAGKKKLMESRQRSLQAAAQMLDRARGEKARLEDQIAALESQHRLVQAAAVGSKFDLDNTKIAQTQKLLGDIRKRLDVAERVLAHEARFTQPIEMKTTSEKELVAQVDEFLSKGATTTAPALAQGE